MARGEDASAPQGAPAAGLAAVAGTDDRAGQGLLSFAKRQALERLLTQPVPILDAGFRRSFRLATDEFHVRDPQSGKGKVVRAAPSVDLGTLLDEAARVRRDTGAAAEWVMYEDGAARSEATRRVVTQEVLVEAPSREQADAAALDAGLVFHDAPAYAPGKYLYRAGSSPDALAAFLTLKDRPDVACTLQLARQQTKKAMPNDTLINQQWHLKYNGQAGAVSGTDLNIESAWAYPTVGAGSRGRGIRIGIVDDGLQTNHPDLAANVDTVNDKDWNGNDFDPSPGSGDDHGTACAGNAGAVGNNSLGVAGTAPESTLVGMRLISGVTTDSMEAEAMSYLPAYIQVKSNSWGPTDDAKTLEGPGNLTAAALKTSAETGRGGLGTIFVWAGGNGLTANDNANYDGYANSIYTIAIGALDSQSRQSWYSEPGANLVVVTPSNGSSPALGITTVDRTGSAGYNSSGDYTSTFGGTSSATPTAAGVIALMLEANPNLGWRDVQEVLMASAKKVNPTDTDWVTNGGGFHHNHKFGAGLVDATAAVSLASGWTNLGTPTKRTVAQTGLSVAIPNQNTTGVTRSFVLGAADNLRVEHVTVAVSITHTARGNLKIVLTSPSGTASRLAEVHSDTGDHYAGWTFMTVRNWGEDAVGTWTLKITDESASGNTTGGTLTAAMLEIFGVAGSVNPPPTVLLTSPTTNMVVSTGTVLQLAATASDLDASGNPGTVASVAFLANGTVLQTDVAAPYAYAWSPTAGVYQVSARATDSEGAPATSPSVQVTVVASVNQPPVVTAASLAPAGQAYSDTPVVVTGLAASDPEDDPITFAFQWQASLNGTVWADQPGQTASSLPASASYAGRLWRCEVRASDGSSTSAPFATASVAINNRPVTNGFVGAAYAYQSALFVPYSGPLPHYRTGIGHQMPPGLSLDPDTGLLSGTPTAAGYYTIVIERYITRGATASQTFALVIVAGGPTGYYAWIAGFPGLSDTAPGADPDGDREPNAVEYFMDLHPGQDDIAGVYASEWTPQGVYLEYRRSKSATGVTGTVVWKTDLAGAEPWSAVGVVDVLIEDRGTYEQRRATVPPEVGETRKFLRLRATLP